jgi:hypothetical protein
MTATGAPPAGLQELASAREPWAATLPGSYNGVGSDIRLKKSPTKRASFSIGYI